MLEREARGLLVAMYMTVTRLSDDGSDLQEEIDKAVEQICNDTRKGVEEALMNLPPDLVSSDWK